MKAILHLSAANTNSHKSDFTAAHWDKKIVRKILSHLKSNLHLGLLPGRKHLPGGGQILAENYNLRFSTIKTFMSIKKRANNKSVLEVFVELLVLDLLADLQTKKLFFSYGSKMCS